MCLFWFHAGWVWTDYSIWSWSPAVDPDWGGSPGAGSCRGCLGEGLRWFSQWYTTRIVDSWSEGEDGEEGVQPFWLLGYIIRTFVDVSVRYYDLFYQGTYFDRYCLFIKLFSFFIWHFFYCHNSISSYICSPQTNDISNIIFLSTNIKYFQNKWH